MILNSNQKGILTNILATKGYDYRHYMAGFGTKLFPNWKTDEICIWINDEFMIRGLLDDATPNEYGTNLENLLDIINRRRL